MIRPTVVRTGARSAGARAAPGLLARALVLAMMLWAGMAGASKLVAHVEDDGDGYRVSADGVVPVAPSIAWAVLTDYNRFDQFLPGVLASRVVRSEGRMRWVSQRGEARLAFFSQAVDVTMQVEETPERTLKIDLVSGDVDALRAEWRLLPENDRAPAMDAPAGARVRVVHAGFYAPRSGLVPRAIVRRVLTRQVQGALDGYVAEMLRRAARAQPSGTVAPAGPGA